MPLAGAAVIIVAFDGILADTLPVRARALAEAIRAECEVDGLALATDELLPLMAGCSFSEAVARAMVRCPSLQRSPCSADLTLHDIIALRAQRLWTSTAAHGVSLRKGVAETLHGEISRGRRIVLRSDSTRRDVEPLLQLANLEDSLLVVRCSDDLPRAAGANSLLASYAAIDTRLNRLHFPPAQRTAVEAGGENAEFALQFAATSRTSL